MVHAKSAPAPPGSLGEYERAAWSAGYASAIAQGVWHPIFISMLKVLAVSAGRYCRLGRQELQGADAEELSQLRLLVRQMMCDWHLLRVERVPLGVIRPDGLDADIAALCGLPRASGYFASAKS